MLLQPFEAVGIGPQRGSCTGSRLIICQPFSQRDCGPASRPRQPRRQQFDDAGLDHSRCKDVQPLNKNQDPQMIRVGQTGCHRSYDLNEFLAKQS